MSVIYIYTSHTKGKSWSDDKRSQKQISKGQRLVTVHEGNEKRFVPGAFLTYKSTDTTNYYHKEINNENYKK